MLSVICRGLRPAPKFTQFRSLHAYDFMKNVQLNGYALEDHTVETEDGYRLLLHRLTRNGAPNKGRPVLLQHGIFACSLDWLVLDGTLAYRLINEDYDVWLGNSRGNIFSRGHTAMSDDCDRFWDFSWHEMGLYDLPAEIDFVLDRTGEKSLVFVGHSQGSTSFFVMASEKPEFASKVSLMMALGPVSGLYNVKNTALKILASQAGTIKKLAERYGHHRIQYKVDFLNKVDPIKAKTLVNSFASFLISLYGYHNEEIIPYIPSLTLGHLQNGCSLKQLSHFAQSLNGQFWFHCYDYGKIENVKVYGQNRPPPYNVANISVPVTLLYGAADWLSNQGDVTSLYELLSCPKKLVEMPPPKYNHLDFIWSKEGVETMLEEVARA